MGGRHVLGPGGLLAQGHKALQSAPQICLMEELSGSPSTWGRSGGAGRVQGSLLPREHSWAIGPHCRSPPRVPQSP